MHWGKSMMHDEYQRVVKAAEFLNNPVWVESEHAGDERKAAERLSEEFGFPGQPETLRDLCRLVKQYPDRVEFELVLAETRKRAKQDMVNALSALEVQVNERLMRGTR